MRNETHPDERTCTYGLADTGPDPLVADISRAVCRNCNFRTAFWTGNHLQMTLMCIPAGGEIGLESHPHLDQFLMVEGGCGLATMGYEREKLDYRRPIREGYGVFVPAGTWHNIINTGNISLKLCSIYAPPQHPHGTVHRTKQEADAAEEY